MQAIERELGKIGRSAGRSASANVVAAGSEIADALGPILADLGARFRRGQRWTVDEAASMGNEAVKIGTRVGSDALDRIADQAKRRPLVTLAVAIGVGILIGFAGRRD
ncbi:MAG TPA: hypothetical protein VMR17_06230 [Xanthobacteraceae bacterium]|nr:hypothetical protein [Xanthobacteraceae bacterium]